MYVEALLELMTLTGLKQLSWDTLLALKKSGNFELILNPLGMQLMQPSWFGQFSKQTRLHQLHA
jgi:hypothetical protein